MKLVVVAVLACACSSKSPPPAQTPIGVEATTPDAAPATADPDPELKPVNADDAKADSKGILDTIATKYMGEIKGCYKSALKVDPTVKGKVQLEITLDATGKVVRGSATMSPSSAVGSTMTTCIEKGMPAWEFSKPSMNEETFRIALALVPE